MYNEASSCIIIVIILLLVLLLYVVFSVYSGPGINYLYMYITVKNHPKM
jgi:hypothetical protein